MIQNSSTVWLFCVALTLGGFGFDELEGHAIAFPNGEEALPILLTLA